MGLLVTRMGYDCNCVVKCHGKLNRGKSDSCLGLSKDHFKHKRGQCFAFASILITAVLSFGSMMNEFNVG